jgi:hypothetical protein
MESFHQKIDFVSIEFPISIKSCLKYGKIENEIQIDEQENERLLFVLFCLDECVFFSYSCGHDVAKLSLSTWFSLNIGIWQEKVKSIIDQQSGVQKAMNRFNKKKKRRHLKNRK